MKRLLAIISLILVFIMAFTSCQGALSEAQDMIETASLAENETEVNLENTADDANVVNTAAEENLTPDASLELEIEAEHKADSNVDASTAPEADSSVDADVEADADENEEADVNTEFDIQTNIDISEKNFAAIPESDILNVNELSGVMRYTSTDGKSKSCNVALTLDYKELIDGNNKTYSQNLSTLSVLLASDVYNGVYVQFNKGATGGNDTPTTLGTMLGLKDVKSYNIKGSDYSVDKDDVTQFVVGHKKVTYNGKTTEIIIVAVRGTNDTNAEWSSNFDVGADTTDYYNAMGKSHPDWKNKKNHKGFDVTANRVYSKLATYISTYVNSNAQTSILLTGHSRGAAIANILGQMFTDKTDYKTYAYTFATPNTTTASTAGNYKNIFNIINQDDIIPYLPLEKWGFKKYGVTKSISIKDNYGTGFLATAKKNSFKWFIGEDYNDDGGKQRTLDCFAALASRREDLYKIDTTSAGKFYHAGNLGLGYSYNDAQTKYNELVKTLENEKLLKFCKVNIVTGGRVWKYRVEINYCPAYFMQILSNMTTGVGPLLGQDLTGKYNDAKLSFVASSGKVVIGGMEHPHMQATYYLIVKNDFKTLAQLNGK